MDCSFQADGSFAVTIVYHVAGVFSTPTTQISPPFSFSRRLSVCRFVPNKADDFIVHGFAARIAEMDGHAVVGGADPLRERAMLTRLLRLAGCYLHFIGSFHKNSFDGWIG